MALALIARAYATKVLLDRSARWWARALHRYRALVLRPFRWELLRRLADAEREGALVTERATRTPGFVCAMSGILDQTVRITFLKSA